MIECILIHDGLLLEGAQGIKSALWRILPFFAAEVREEYFKQLRKSGALKPTKGYGR